MTDGRVSDAEATGRMPGAAIVLAGGRASRMGEDKILAPLGRDEGDTVLGRVLAACAGITVVLVGPPDLERAVPAGMSVRLVREDPPFGGPVAGLRAALEALPPGDRLVALLAGDQPHLDAAALAELTATLIGAIDAPPPSSSGNTPSETPQTWRVSRTRRGGGAVESAAYLAAEGHVQFLCAVWHEDALRARTATAGASMRSVYADARVLLLPDPRAVAADVDTPADLAAARHRISGTGGTP